MTKTRSWSLRNTKSNGEDRHATNELSSKVTDAMVGGGVEPIGDEFFCKE